MCVIIHKPADKRISYRTLRRAYHANQHGWGLVAKDATGALTVARGTSKIGDLITEYKKVEDQEVLIHCRIATSGEKDIVNTHPFEVMPGVWMMHNGTLWESMVPIRDKSKCDSWHFAKDILAPTLKNNPLFLQYPVELKFIEDLEEYIGPYSSNKIVIMSRFGPTIIAGKRKGEEKDGVWFSNASAFRGSDEHKKRAARFAKGDNKVIDNKTGYYASEWPGGYESFGYNGNTCGNNRSHINRAGVNTQGPASGGTTNKNATGQGTVIPLHGKRDNVSTGSMGDANKTGGTGTGTGPNGTTDKPGSGGGTHSSDGVSAKGIPSHNDSLRDKDFAISHLQIVEDINLAEDLREDAAEALRYDAAFRYAEILANFSLDDLKIVVEKHPEGLAEVLLYLLNGDMPGLAETLADHVYADGPDDEEEPEVFIKDAPRDKDVEDTVTEAEAEIARMRSQDAYENVIEQEFGRLECFNELWARCYTSELEGQLMDEEMRR